jgi:hypothetical protein
MPKRTFHLKNDKQDTITVSWKLAWKQTQIFFNDNLIGSLDGEKELKKGNVFEIDDFRKLSIKLKGKVLPELELLINGKYIDGSPTDPTMQLKGVYNLILVLAGLSVLVGTITEVFQVELLMNAGLGLGSIITGVVMLGLGYWVSKRSMIALALIFLIIISDIVATFWMATHTHASGSQGIVLKIFILIYLFKGFGAIKKLKQTTEYSK